MSYLFCKNMAEALKLEQEARDRVPEILREFANYFNCAGEVGINVRREQNVMFWSVEADLTFDGEIVKSYPAFDLLEMDLLHMELGVMMKCGYGIKR